MRAGHVSPERLAPYYRTFSTQTLHFGATVIGPHALTMRAEYTVPTNRKAYVAGARAQVMRNGAAATVGLVSCVVEVDYGMDLTVMHMLNTVGSSEHSSMLMGMWLNPGATVDIMTADPSTGGNMNYEAVAQINEFEMV